jgi:hypothetical protein
LLQILTFYSFLSSFFLPYQALQVKYVDRQGARDDAPVTPISAAAAAGDGEWVFERIGSRLRIVSAVRDPASPNATKMVRRVLALV